MYSDRELPATIDDCIVCDHYCCEGSISCLIDDGTGETVRQIRDRVKREHRNELARKRYAEKKAEEAAEHAAQMAFMEEQGLILEEDYDEKHCDHDDCDEFAYCLYGGNPAWERLSRAEKEAKDEKRENYFKEHFAAEEAKELEFALNILRVEEEFRMWLKKNNPEALFRFPHNNLKFTAVNVNGCKLCGHVSQGHFLRGGNYAQYHGWFHGSKGLHSYEEPSDELRILRLKAKRYGIRSIDTVDAAEVVKWDYITKNGLI